MVAMTVDFSRAALGVIGIAGALGLFRYISLRRSRSSFTWVSIVAVASAVLLVLAFFPALVNELMPDSRIGRIRMAVAALSVFIMVVTFESIRQTQLKERYALLWVLPCLMVLFLTARPAVMNWLKVSLGMEYASSMLAVVFITVMASVFVLSKSISKNEKNISQIAQKCAMLEARIHDLEGKKGP